MGLSFGNTDLAPIEMPPGVIGFGAAEIVYLLARREMQETAAAAEVLVPGVADIWDPEAAAFQLVKAGGSSLIARGLIQVQPDNTLVSKGEAGLLEYVLGTAERWTTMTMVAEDGLDRGLIMHAPDLIAMMQFRQLGSWFTTFVDVQAPQGDLIVSFTKLLAAAHPESAFVISTWTLRSKPRKIYVRFDIDEQRWDVVDRSHDVANERREWLDEDALKARLAALLAVSGPPTDSVPRPDPRDTEEKSRVMSTLQSRLG